MTPFFTWLDSLPTSADIVLIMAAVAVLAFVSLWCWRESRKCDDWRERVRKGKE